MDLDILKWVYFDQATSEEFFELVESIIVIVGDPDCIMAFNNEIELSWYHSHPDRMLEITIYEDNNLDMWYQKTLFSEEENEEEWTETGNIGEQASLLELKEWFEDES
jgi:hypothetical protein